MTKFATLKGNRRKVAGVFSLALAACLLLLLPGCQGPTGPQAVPDTARTGSLSLTLEGPPSGSARTALPDGSLIADFQRLMFTFTAVGHDRTFGPIPKYYMGGINIDDTIDIPNIPVGTWTLAVGAYIYDPADGDAVDGWVQKAYYMYYSLVIAAGSNAANVNLNPVANGYGEFAWEVTFPASVAEFSVSVFNWPNRAPQVGQTIDFICGDDGWVVYNGYVTVTGSFGEPLAAGTYWAVFRLADGITNNESVMTVGTILRIYRNMVSVFARELDFATMAELAIDAINLADLGIVTQPWIGTATYPETPATATLAAALAQVQDLIDAVVYPFGVKADVEWYDAPTVDDTGDNNTHYFAVTIVDMELTARPNARVNFLASEAQQAYAAITGALSVIQALHEQPWRDNLNATIGDALYVIQTRVDNAIGGINSDAAVDWGTSEQPADIPEPGLPEAYYVFTVDITGLGDGTVRDTTVTVPIRFGGHDEVIATRLIDLYAVAYYMLGTAVASPDGANVSMAQLWTIPGLRQDLDGEKAAAGLVLADYENDDATQEEVDYAYNALRAAYDAFRDARRLGRLELVQAHEALENRHAGIVAREDEFTPQSWMAFANARNAAYSVILSVDPLDPATADSALGTVLQQLQNALAALNAAIGNLVSQADYDAVYEAYLIARDVLETMPGDASQEEIRLAVISEIDNDDVIVSVTVSVTTPAGPGIPGLETIEIELTVESEYYTDVSRTITETREIPALPVEGTLTITWTGFNNPLASLGIAVNQVTGEITLTWVNVQPGEVRWYVGMTPLPGGTDAGITVNPLPPLVTIRAIGDGRPYSIVIDTFGDGSIF